MGQPLQPISVISETDDVVLTRSQSEFDQLSLPEKIRSVTHKYYSTCQQISNFCTDNPFLSNCKESCAEFYPAWGVSLNATLESSTDPILFTQILTKESFAEYDEQTQWEIINSGYFSGCEQIMDYCLNIESIEGCHEYCSGFLLEPSYYGDLYNNGSKVVIK